MSTTHPPPSDNTKFIYLGVFHDPYGKAGSRFHMMWREKAEDVGVIKTYPIDLEKYRAIVKMTNAPLPGVPTLVTGSKISICQEDWGYMDVSIYPEDSDNRPQPEVHPRSGQGRKHNSRVGSIKELDETGLV